MPQQLSLEELGMLQLLEKISEDSGSRIDRFARYGLTQGGLITDGQAPRLTELGAARLEALRRARDAGDCDASLASSGDPDPTPA